MDSSLPSLVEITHVAIEFNGKVWSLPKPNRHHHVIRAIAAENGTGINGPDIQGDELYSEDLW